MKTDNDARRQRAQVRRVTWIGLAANLLLAGFKLAAGLLGRSRAVVADAVHSVSDASTDIAVLIGVRYWTAPADSGHPHGHGRIEMLVTVFIGSVLALAAFGLAFDSVAALTAGGEHGVPGWTAFGAAIISMVVKEVLYQWTARVGRRVRSSALEANAWHHRSDALSSIPAALAVLGARINPDWAFLDHAGALVVSVMILIVAWRILTPALGKLADAGAGPDKLAAIRDAALSVESVRDVHKIRTRYLGVGLQVDLHLLVDRNLTVERGHEISDQVKARLKESDPDIIDAVIHIEPA